jgi:hypothetical protein
MDADPSVPHAAAEARHGRRRMGIALGLGAVAGLALGLALGFVLWKPAATATSAPDPRIALAHAQAQLATLQQREATLQRSDQISREANLDLQATLADREEQIAGLRADVQFYERFVGSNTPVQSLRVHALALQPAGDGAWHFRATLTQTLNRGAVSRGQLRLDVEAMLDGRLQRLDWARLRPAGNTQPLPYAFKYFQQIEGDIALPAGAKPVRVRVRLQPEGGAAVERSLPWDTAVQGEAG